MNREKHLETILVLVFALGVYYYLSHNNYVLLAAGILAFIGIFLPRLADKIHWLWMKLAHALGFVMSKVLLTIVYVIFLLPISYLSKKFSKNNGIVLKRGLHTYYKTRSYTYTKESMENVW